MQVSRDLSRAANAASPLLRTAHVDFDGPDAAHLLLEQIDDHDLALLALFVSPDADFERIISDIAKLLPATRIVGCTTAGEIVNGYSEGGILAVGFPTSDFCAETLIVEDIDELEKEGLVSQIIRKRADLTVDAPGWVNEFAFLLIDGLSRKEDEVVAMIMSGLGQVPLFGGSAGDGTRFGETKVACGGRVMQNAAVLTFLRTRCTVQVFSLDNLLPTTQRMVVTEADPKRRIVRQINAEPAAREYARLLGKDPEQLDQFTFAAHPVVVRFGGQHHVRAIQQVSENGDLIFFAAIHEGMVLTLAETEDMAAHLDQKLTDLGTQTEPGAILACDCILRRIDAQRQQNLGAVTKVLSQHNVVGFSTYGEQFNGLHVNQTMTGIAIYPPGTALK